MYLDDWLFCQQKSEIILQLTTQVIYFLWSLEWEVNLDKSTLTPSSSFEYLGLLRQSTSSSHGGPSAGQTAAWSDCSVLPDICYFSKFSSTTDCPDFRYAGITLYSPCTAHSGDFKIWDVLEVWKDTAWLLQGVLDSYLFMDNSLEDWGASLSWKDIKDSWRESYRSLHINRLALLAVKLALQHFREEYFSSVTTPLHRPTAKGGRISASSCGRSWISARFGELIC